ncbi:uncharacterized protein LOC115216726 isoform X1 [Octopus sinensis]|uniref:Uncharacterized protein LOC115216726 isoform X1 n=1 Tax=Octopus sinensis TaxID=2607531 RepID=A0A6P7SV76_9MOLL|nr:uncharacterized protein LOC115216726 isoform X1 [Octopus sinensis]
MADYKTEEEIWNSNRRKLSNYLEKKNSRGRSSASDEGGRNPFSHPRFGKYRPNRTLSHPPLGHTFPSVNCLRKEEPSKYSQRHTQHRNSTWPYGYKVLPSPQTAREKEEEEELTHRKTDKGTFQKNNEEQINRIICKEILYEDILHPVISDMLYETAHWTLQFYAQKFYRRDLNELFSVTNFKLVDSMVLEQLLYHEAQPKKLWTDSEIAEKALDAMILNAVLNHQCHMFTTCAVTQECQMLRNIQLNAVTDIALDVLMEQLVASLSEDLKDLDDYQTGSML